MKLNLKNKPIVTACALGVITLVVYLLFYKGEGAHYNYFSYLAESFLSFRLNVLNSPPWHNELVNYLGKSYVVYPPMPAVLMMPFVALFGLSFPQPYLSNLISAINVSLCFLTIYKIFKSQSLALLIAILFSFGTMHWYHGQVGSSWYIAHIVGLLFIWLSLLEAFTKKRFFVVGLFIGLAYLSRLPMVLSIVFIPLYFIQDFIKFDRFKPNVNFKNILLLSLGVSIGILINFAYNYLRFGVIQDLAYDLLPLSNEPWYNHGFFSYKYIPLRLSEMFWSFPRFQPTPPYLIPSVYSMAIWFTTPAFLLILLAPFKSRIVWVSLLTAVVMAIPSLVKGGNGFTQFGFRYALDFIPFLIIPTAAAINLHYKKLWVLIWLLIILSVLINLWGVIMLSHLSLWVW